MSSYKNIELREQSIQSLFFSADSLTMVVPIYQRNYAWGLDEIATLVSDVNNAYHKGAQTTYYIGTLVTYHRGEQVYEVIDGQQRLTTIWLLLRAMQHKQPSLKLTYQARTRATYTIKHLPELEDGDELTDTDILQGYANAQRALQSLGLEDDERSAFENFFLNNVHVLHYQVPRDIDLNHYFEVMNSRGVQLEQHEIVKARLMEQLTSANDRMTFAFVWECCSSMSIYVQRSFAGKAAAVFEKNLTSLPSVSFDTLVSILTDDNTLAEEQMSSITRMLHPSSVPVLAEDDSKQDDAFQPIIDFPNFLLIVLKMHLMQTDTSFSPAAFVLDDYELLKQFEQYKPMIDVQQFCMLLLKARFLLDNYIVHHTKEQEQVRNNPWKLQMLKRDDRSDERDAPVNLFTVITHEEDDPRQAQMVHLLSMFEVAFTARQRKNYLFYCLYYLSTCDTVVIDDYLTFLDKLAFAYIHKIYLVRDRLNSINTPKPQSFDEALLDRNTLSIDVDTPKSINDFKSIYGDADTSASKGITLFVFNYMDYCIWKRYASDLRGKQLKKGNAQRDGFFTALGCPDFGLEDFDNFYFSRTRRSLEHFYAQAFVDADISDKPTIEQINCFGNFAMIGSEANSSASNWSPKTKVDHYLDSSHKISLISVASLKMLVMLSLCRQNGKWGRDEIIQHQDKMLELMLN